MESDQTPLGLLLYCRPGFEKECAQEILDVETAREIYGFVKVAPGHVLFMPSDPKSRERLGEGSDEWSSLVFARQRIDLLGILESLPTEDRLTPILDLLKMRKDRFSEVWIETADTNEAKSLSVFLRKFSAPLKKALKEAGYIGCQGQARLHLFFTSGRSVMVGASSSQNSSPWLMGIPRLKFPKGAPSRSTLKLDEAFGAFLNDPDRALQPAMRAVDLGASPGGWTFQLVRRHLRTVAVDNGPMDGDLMDSGLVTHLRVDGFRYRPDRPVDWLVCDMVEKPTRIAHLMGEWLSEGLCRYAIFNLKLPMKKRYEAYILAEKMIRESLAKSPYRYRLRFRQLYHDRQEVTGFAERVGD